MNNRSRMIVQYTICLGAFLSNLSAGMFNIALVDIARTFDSTIPTAQWIVTAYLLVISILLPVMGKLGDMLGRRKIHNIGYFIFMVGALCCAVSPSLNGLISSRILQGIGAAMYQATNMALIISVFPKEQRGKALGLISTFVAAGSMIGPSLGGILIQWFSWRSNFWLLTALSLIAWMFAQRFIPKDKPEGSESRLDVPGAALFAISLTGLVTAVNLGAQWGWSSWQVAVLFILFGVGAASFIGWCLSSRWERQGKGRLPFMKLDLFRDAGISVGIIITIISYMAAFSAQLVLPVFLLSELGIEPATAGLIMMGYPLSLIIFSPLSGNLSDKLGTFPLLSAGLLVMTTALLILGFVSPAYPIFFLILLIVLLGGSMGLITPPNNSLVMSRTSKSDLGLISSILALSRNLGMMFGTAAGGAMLALPDQAAGGLTGFRMIFVLNTVLVVIVYLTMIISFRLARHKETLSS
ncbi:MFS transporter [Paenibacillus glucanolyticus]|uniref:MFS transporter n=1 Tax=Paenibacillus glucanolyticus TaxID=59843 RepID=UPI00096DE403|nr:MFS transporter [Paenibacillus glucanolyticus]OMF74216.1 MFS transporter [Paenibacillus glucanolyticus]